MSTARSGGLTHLPPFLLALSLLLIGVLFATPALTESRTVASGKCLQLSEPEWTDQEQWVWTTICQGHTADLGQRETQEPRPNTSTASLKTKALRSSFIEFLVREEQHRNIVARRGLHIKGAVFERPLDLSDADLDMPIEFANCRFESDVDLGRTRIKHWLSLKDSTVKGTLYLNGVHIAGNLMLDGMFNSVQLDSAQIARLYMNKGTAFEGVSLEGTQIEDVLDLSGFIFKGELNLRSLNVGTNFLMKNVRAHNRVDLFGSTIEGDLTMTDSVFDDMLDMTSIYVGGTLSIDHVTMPGPESRISSELGAVNISDIELAFSNVEGNLNLINSLLSSVDLTGTSIKGELRLGINKDNYVQWHEDAKLTLRNTTVGALQDWQDAWPPALDLDGFVYGHLGGRGGNGLAGFISRETAWFREWLGKQQPYSPQPYEQLATLMDKAGYPDIAKEVRYESKEKERLNASFGRWLWLTALKVFIGYGYRTLDYAIRWLIAFTLLGTAMLKVSSDNPFKPHWVDNPGLLPKWAQRAVSGRLARAIENNLPLLAYSFDRFLPLVKLRDYHYTRIDLQGWLAYYFYFHQLIGFTVATLLLASITGLIAR